MMNNTSIGKNDLKKFIPSRTEDYIANVRNETIYPSLAEYIRGEIYEHLKKKPSLDNKSFKTLNPEQVYDVLSKHSNETVSIWFKLQQAWCNNAYNTFKDYDTYLILVYLVNQVFQKYSDRFQYLSYGEFYEKNEFKMLEIN